VTPARKWTIAIAGLLGVNVVASVVLAMTASHGSSQVIPDYYERAVHYDDAIPGRFYTADPWGNRLELLAG